MDIIKVVLFLIKRMDLKRKQNINLTCGKLSLTVLVNSSLPMLQLLIRTLKAKIC